MASMFKKNESKPLPLRSYAFGVTAFWLLLIIASFGWNLKTQRLGTLEAARVEARTAFETDILYRRWNAKHGGLYAPVTEETLPNPYLDVPERDITTPAGKQLTIINPAYMTRQVHEMEKSTKGVIGHITSLNPIRPANTPDPWETLALNAFQTGTKEVSSVEKMEDKNYMRLMKPLVTEQGCLKCHAVQGYKLGDIRGGISVSVPMAPLMAIERHHFLTLSAGHGLLWLVGLFGIGFALRRLSQQINKRLEVEKELQNAHDDLEIRVKERTAELVTSNEQLNREIEERMQMEKQLIQSEKLASVGELAAGVAHEINNPINGVINYAQILIDEAEEQSNGAAIPKRILKEAERVVGIVKNLLDFARESDDKPSPAAVGDIIADALELVGKQLSNDDITVEINIQNTLPGVLVNRHKVQQVFLNLFSNARYALNEKFSDFDTNKVITIKGEVKEVNGKTYSRITIHDQGVGISGEIIDKVCDPFFSSKPRGEGTGLGLSISYGIVKDQGGNLLFESEEGEYTKVIVDLPAIASR